MTLEKFKKFIEKETVLVIAFFLGGSIGLGTVISMVCVGRFIAMINKATKQKLLRLAGLG